MRVLFWSELFWPEISGVTIFGMNLMSALQKKGCEFTIITCQGKHSSEARIKYGNLDIYRFPFHTALLQKNFRTIRSIIDQIKRILLDFTPDIVHVNSSEPSLFFLEKINSLKKAKLLVTVHMSLACKHGSNSLFSRLLGSADCVTAVSDAMCQDILDFKPGIANKTKKIFNALPAPSIRRQQLDFEKPVILCLGRISREKGFETALKAFPLVLERHEKAKLMVAGHGPELEPLKKLAESIGIGRSVIFKGAVPLDQVLQCINESIMVLVPSRWREPFGLVALQAGQMGRPVIASDRGGLPEIIEHGTTGYLLKDDDVKTLSYYMNNLLDNPQTAESMGKEAVKHVEKKFDFTSFAENYYHIYQDMIKSQQ